MLKKLYKKFSNRYKYFAFLISEKINGDYIANKVMHINKLSSQKEKIIKTNKLFNKHSDHPMVFYAQVFINCWNDPEKTFNLLKKYEQIRNKWLKNKSLSGIFKTGFIPVETVTGSFGNIWPLFHYIKYKKNFEGSEEKPNLLLRDTDKPTNGALFSFFRPYLNVIQSTTLNYKLNYFSELFRIPIGVGLPFKDSYYLWPFAINLMQQEMKNLEKLKFNYFKLSQEDNKKGLEILKKMGLPENAWYVTLHVRQGKGELVRNSDPLTTLKAVKEIISRGGYVFRVGDKSMTKLPKIEGLIDYPFTEHKSEFMDIFLAATCNFCLGTSSGYYAVPTFFGKPVLLINFLPTLVYFALDEKCLFLPKHLSYKKNKKVIPIEDIFQLPLGWLIDDKQYKKSDIEIKDNDENEIWQATVEMLDKLEGKKLSKEFIVKNQIFKNNLDKKYLEKYKLPLKAMSDISAAYLNRNLT